MRMRALFFWRAWLKQFFRYRGKGWFTAAAAAAVRASASCLGKWGFLMDEFCSVAATLVLQLLQRDGTVGFREFVDSSRSGPIIIESWKWRPSRLTPWLLWADLSSTSLWLLLQHRAWIIRDASLRNSIFYLICEQNTRRFLARFRQSFLSSRLIKESFRPTWTRALAPVDTYYKFKPSLGWSKRKSFSFLIPR